jgi:pimeloyl-ACP methyl ester carboxylesterase
VKVYFISGIGADHRVFTYLRLPEGYEASYVHWIVPEENEPLGDYAFRLSKQIDTTNPFILVGLSLGGIMSVEIAKHCSPVSTILISSVPDSAHLPKIYRMAGKLKMGKLIHPSLLKTAAILKHSLTMRSAANRALMKNVILDGDNHFISWALNAVLDWENHEIPRPLYHIHGTRDEVFPIGLTRPTHIVRKVGHMFLVSHPETVNQFLREVISTPS